MASELRFIAEFAHMAASRPLLKRLPKGEGQPIIIAPSFMLGDGGTVYMRRCLFQLGYRAYGWGQGRNLGIDQRLLDGFLARIDHIADKYQQKVTISGWSLGGVYARAAASLRPDTVRQVITIGSPFNAPTMDEDAVSGPVLKLYELVNSGGPNDPMLALKDDWQRVPKCPSTAIYSEGDGIAHWHYCIDPLVGQTENIRVRGSHLGLTHNAAVLYALVDRLNQPEGQWAPMEINTCLRKSMFKVPNEEKLAEAQFVPA